MPVEIESGLVAVDAGLVRFYVDALGFEIDGVLEFPVGTVHRLRRERARIKIFVPADGARLVATDPWHATAGFRYAALLVDDVDVEVGRVLTHGGSVELGPVAHRPGVRMALVRDPAGNVLELLSERSTP